jgi:alpha-ketoglutarate-dependent taurine dioxygenase
MAISIERIHPRFGARITGIDLAKPLDDPTFASVADAFNEDSVLVFPGQQLSDEQQIVFSRRFGPLEETIDSIANNPKVARQIHSFANSRGLVSSRLLTPEHEAQVPPVERVLARANP